jgi:hypothetical protein
MNDFEWGKFHIRSGKTWMQISGILKKTGKDTKFMEILFENGHGTIYEEEKEGLE